MSYTAGSVMDMSASLMNDTAKTLYTYPVQLPYLRMAQKDLEKDFILSEVPLQLERSAVIPVVSGSGTLALPADFFIPLRLYERRTGSTKENDFVEMRERFFEPLMDPVLNLNEWTFREGAIQFSPATENKDIKLEYYKLITVSTDQNTIIVEDGASNVLGYKTASLLSKYIAKDFDRASALVADYNEELDKLLSIYTKNRQGVRVRRKPFRLGRIR